MRGLRYARHKTNMHGFPYDLKHRQLEHTRMISVETNDCLTLADCSPQFSCTMPIDANSNQWVLRAVRVFTYTESSHEIHTQKRRFLLSLLNLLIISCVVFTNPIHKSYTHTHTHTPVYLHTYISLHTLYKYIHKGYYGHMQVFHIIVSRFVGFDCL